MTRVANGMGVTDLSVSGVAKEEAVLDRLFLRSDSRSSMKLSCKSKLGIHYSVFTHNRRKQAKLACINNGYRTCILS
jgi:hypothetical protein